MVAPSVLWPLRACGPPRDVGRGLGGAAGDVRGDGFTGGKIERSVLQRLLAGIDAGRAGIVLVYKADRLSRSLLGFAQLLARLEVPRPSEGVRLRATARAMYLLDGVFQRVAAASRAPRG